MSFAPNGNPVKHRQESRITMAIRPWNRPRAKTTLSIMTLFSFPSTDRVVAEEDYSSVPLPREEGAGARGE